ncbi:MAG: flagellar biosynthetic protein FliO [Lachnospiraceae bacterium]|nr:flagellar biosynthetic protein FliO [Lachnospiraceae bacterium]
MPTFVLLNNQTPQFAESATLQSGTNSVLRFVTLLIIFAAVVAICYFTTRFVAGKEKNKMGSKNMLVLETTRLAPNKYIGLVKVGERYVAVAYGKDSIVPICEVPKEEITIDPNSGQPTSFGDIFRKVSGKKNASEPAKKSLAQHANILKMSEDEDGLYSAAEDSVFVADTTEENND